MVTAVAEEDAVVNDQTSLIARALPARSFTPRLPPVIVAVYDLPATSGCEGVKVAAASAVVADRRGGALFHR